MRIFDLFEKDPNRDIVNVVKVNDHTPEIVKMELEEYVPTEEVKEYFRRIIENFVETRRGYSENVCVWISGFFGSGKSHFLKMLGYLLENRELKVDGEVIHSTSYIATKIGLQNLAPIISKEFKTKVFFINLLDYDHAVDPTISRLIYRKLMEEIGFSDKIWVSLWEEELCKINKFEDFKEWVKGEYKRDWSDFRKLNAEMVLRKALPRFLGYESEDDAEKAIEESKKQEIKPSDIVKRLKRYAEEIDKNKGRIVVLLDEVGLYIGDSTNRLTDLNALAEQVVKEGDGKVWLITTAQEALPEMVDRFAAERQKLEWLRDRFKHYSLTPAGVKKVVLERMLKKNVNAISILKRFYRDNAGMISQALSLESAKLIFDKGEDEFVEFYPFMPYSITLLQEISRSLVRTVDEARRLSASERSMLKIVHTILRGEGSVDSFAEKELGAFVTFDVLYDSISSDLRFIKSEYHNIIENEIGKLGEIDNVKISSVAKSLFLLQTVGEKVPCSLSNLSAVLFSDIKLDINTHKEAIKKCLEKLGEYGWVIEENGIYRLLTYEEHSLEKVLKENLPRPGEKRRFLREIIGEKLKKFKYQHGKSKRPFELEIVIDGEEISKGELKVVIYTLFSEKDEDQILMESAENPNTVYWLAPQDTEFENLIERTIALRETLKQLRTLASTETQKQYIKTLEDEFNRNSKEIIPRKTESILKNGIVFLNGMKSSPSDSFEKALQEKLRSIANEVYSEFIDMRPSKDEECASILKWPEGKIPSIYRELNIVVSNRLNVSSKVPSTVFKQIEYRRKYGLSRTGRDLIEDFDKKPYGWDPRIVRLAVASLFKAGKISVMWNNKIYYSTAPEIYNVFSKISQFNRASFDVLPEVNWRKASELISIIFGERSEDTFEKTSEKVRELAAKWSNKAMQLKTRVIDNELPQNLRNTVENFLKTINEISSTSDPNTRLRVFLEGGENLKKTFKIVRKLEEFNFGKYREIKKFIENPIVRSVLSDLKDKIEYIYGTIQSEAIVDRLNDVIIEFSTLVSKFTNRYKEKHESFNKWVEKALEDVRKHRAFELRPENAESKISELKGLKCDSIDFDTNLLFCKNCKRHFTEMSETQIKSKMLKILKELDTLLPVEKKEKPKPFEIKKIVKEDEIEDIIGEIKDYFARYKGRFEVEIRIKPEEE